MTMRSEARNEWYTNPEKASRLCAVLAKFYDYYLAKQDLYYPLDKFPKAVRLEFAYWHRVLAMICQHFDRINDWNRIIYETPETEKGQLAHINQFTEELKPYITGKHYAHIKFEDCLIPSGVDEDFNLVMTPDAETFLQALEARIEQFEKTEYKG